MAKKQKSDLTSTRMLQKQCKEAQAELSNSFDKVKEVIIKELFKRVKESSEYQLEDDQEAKVRNWINLSADLYLENLKTDHKLALQEFNPERVAAFDRLFKAIGKKTAEISEEDSESDIDNNKLTAQQVSELVKKEFDRIELAFPEITTDKELGWWHIKKKIYNNLNEIQKIALKQGVARAGVRLASLLSGVFTAGQANWAIPLASRLSSVVFGAMRGSAVHDVMIVQAIQSGTRKKIEFKDYNIESKEKQGILEQISMFANITDLTESLKAMDQKLKERVSGFKEKLKSEDLKDEQNEQQKKDLLSLANQYQDYLVKHLGIVEGNLANLGSEEQIKKHLIEFYQTKKDLDYTLSQIAIDQGLDANYFKASRGEVEKAMDYFHQNYIKALEGRKKKLQAYYISKSFGRIFGTRAMLAGLGEADELMADLSKEKFGHDISFGNALDWGAEKTEKVPIVGFALGKMSKISKARRNQDFWQQIVPEWEKFIRNAGHWQGDQKQGLAFRINPEGGPRALLKDKENLSFNLELKIDGQHVKVEDFDFGDNKLRNVIPMEVGECQGIKLILENQEGGVGEIVLIEQDGKLVEATGAVNYNRGTKEYSFANGEKVQYLDDPFGIKGQVKGQKLKSPNYDDLINDRNYKEFIESQGIVKSQVDLQDQEKVFSTTKENLSQLLQSASIRMNKPGFELGEQGLLVKTRGEDGLWQMKNAVPDLAESKFLKEANLGAPQIKEQYWTKRETDEYIEEVKAFDSAFKILDQKKKTAYIAELRNYLEAKENTILSTEITYNLVGGRKLVFTVSDNHNILDNKVFLQAKTINRFGRERLVKLGEKRQGLYQTKAQDLQKQMLEVLEREYQIAENTKDVGFTSEQSLLDESNNLDTKFVRELNDFAYKSEDRNMQGFFRRVIGNMPTKKQESLRKYLCHYLPQTIKRPGGGYYSKYLGDKDELAEFCTKFFGYQGTASKEGRIYQLYQDAGEFSDGVTFAVREGVVDTKDQKVFWSEIHAADDSVGRLEIYNPKNLESIIDKAENSDIKNLIENAGNIWTRQEIKGSLKARQEAFLGQLEEYEKNISALEFSSARLNQISVDFETGKFVVLNNLDIENLGTNDIIIDNRFQNNPGNIKFNQYIQDRANNLGIKVSCGRQAADGGNFCEFASAKDGFKFLVNFIKNPPGSYIKKFGNDITLAEFMSRYAPSSSNPTDSYLGFLEKVLDTERGAKLLNIDHSKLAQAIAYFESGAKIKFNIGDYLLKELEGNAQFNSLRQRKLFLEYLKSKGELRSFINKKKDDQKKEIDKFLQGDSKDVNVLPKENNIWELRNITVVNKEEEEEEGTVRLNVRIKNNKVEFDFDGDGKPDTLGDIQGKLQKQDYNFNVPKDLINKKAIDKNNLEIKEGQIAFRKELEQQKTENQPHVNLLKDCLEEKFGNKQFFGPVPDIDIALEETVDINKIEPADFNKESNIDVFIQNKYIAQLANAQTNNSAHKGFKQDKITVDGKDVTIGYKKDGDILKLDINNDGKIDVIAEIIDGENGRKKAKVKEILLYKKNQEKPEHKINLSDDNLENKENNLKILSQEFTNSNYYSINNKLKFFRDSNNQKLFCGKEIIDIPKNFYVKKVNFVYKEGLEASKDWNQQTLVLWDSEVRKGILVLDRDKDGVPESFKIKGKDLQEALEKVKKGKHEILDNASALDGIGILNNNIQEIVKERWSFDFRRGIIKV